MGDICSCVPTWLKLTAFIQEKLKELQNNEVHTIITEVSKFIGEMSVGELLHHDTVTETCTIQFLLECLINAAVPVIIN